MKISDLVKPVNSLEIQKEMLKEQYRDLEDQRDILLNQEKLNEQHRKAIKGIRRKD